MSGKIFVCFNEYIKSLPSITSFLASIIRLFKYLLLKTLADSSKAVSKLVPDSIIKAMVLENLSISEVRIKLPISGILRNCL